MSIPVVAAIPNYNMADSLHELLPQLLEQEYARVVVLDDASNDHSVDVVGEFGSAVDLVRGETNVGAGSNRNRILGVLDNDVVIHFIDADMQPETDRMPEAAASLVEDPDIGFVGGLIKNQNGLQMHFNYGPRQCLRNDVQAPLQDYIGRLAEKDYERAKRLHSHFANYLRRWPNIFVKPEEKDVFWAAEANLVIPSRVFRDFGGYSEGLRDHEIQDLAIRLSQSGIRRRFSPLISAVHTAVEVRDGNRRLNMLKAEYEIQRKHGFRKYLFSPTE